MTTSDKKADPLLLGNSSLMNGELREQTHDNIYIAAASNSNREIALQLEAIRSHDNRRPILTPDDFGVFLRDDAISRVVS